MAESFAVKKRPRLMRIAARLPVDDVAALREIGEEAREDFSFALRLVVATGLKAREELLASQVRAA